LINERYANHEVRKRLEILGPERGRYCCRTTVREVIAIPQRNSKCHANANVAGSAGDRFGLLDHTGDALRIMTVIDGGDSATRVSSEGDGRAEIGVDLRFLSQHREPQFQRLVFRPDRKGPEAATVIVRVDQCRQHQKSIISKRCGSDH
jgi:hypothetical protein